MVALLGLLAVAGYQNRDKIAEMLGSAGNSGNGQGGLLGKLGGLAGGASAGNILSEGLGSLIEHFKQNGRGDAASSWVNTGPNQTISAAELEHAIGPDVLATLVQRTGLSRDELLSRLAIELPTAVDKMTPAGKVPTPEEANQLA
jgi:uncharacterized protein YidB (DUF937 family)